MMGRRLDRKDGVVDPDALEELARMMTYLTEVLVMLLACSRKARERGMRVMDLFRRTSRRRI